MARTLSPARPFAYAFVTTLGLIPLAGIADAEPRSGATAGAARASYRNPFAAEADRPQADAILLPGPRSRWRSHGMRPSAGRPVQSATANAAAAADQPTVLRLNAPLGSAGSESATSGPGSAPRAEETSVRTAVLTAGGALGGAAAPRPGDEAAPLLGDAPEIGGPLVATAESHKPPDPARYTTGPSEKPTWLEGAKQTRPTVSTAPANRHGSRPGSVLNGGAAQGARRGQPPRRALIIEQTALEEPRPAAAPATSAIAIVPREETENNAGADVISDLDETPSGWLVEAQEKSRTAQTLEELAAVSQLCERAISAGPEDNLVAFAQKLAAWAHNRRGELLIDGEQPIDALAEFQAAIELDPENSLALHNRAVTLAQQSDFEAALADFNRVIELNPGLAVAYRNRGELLAAQGKSDDAIRDYTRAIEAMPEDAELYRARAHALHQLDQYEAALNDLDRSIQLAPRAAQGLSQRGNLLADRGEYQRAIEDFKQALATEPQLAEAHRGLAWIKATCPDERLRDAFEALGSAHTAVKLSPLDDWLALDVLAAAHANAGEFDKAVAAQQRAISAAPADSIPSMRARLHLYERRQPYRVGR